MDYQYYSFIEQWRRGEAEGGIGITAKNISGHVKRYLAVKFGEVCSVCKWSKRNVVTGKVPLEIDHIDGDSENNIEANLRLICPNCHALTSSYRNLNKGKGRGWRRLKYVKNTGMPP